MPGVILAVVERPAVAARTLAAAQNLAELSNAGRINVLAIRIPPLETILPLATALNLPVYHSLKDDAGIKKMVNAVLNEFPGQIVLICWHHGKIPEIAKALGIAKPPKWDGKLFDRVWEITFPKGKAALKDLPQMLLYGDSAK